MLKGVRAPFVLLVLGLVLIQAHDQQTSPNLLIQQQMSFWLILVL